MKNNWNATDLKTVNIMTLVNGLWSGFIVWLIIGLWLEMAGFIACWLGATTFSFFVALNRVGAMVERRNNEESMEK
tara:strand:- start:285 stop:512 length:228 start_codon:yes stop_codon:yes gene_type:complete